MKTLRVGFALLALFLTAGCAAESETEDGDAAISGMPGANRSALQAIMRIATKQVILERYAAADPRAFEPYRDEANAFRWRPFALDEKIWDEWFLATSGAGYRDRLLVTEEGRSVLTFALLPQSGPPVTILRCDGVTRTTGPNPAGCVAPPIP